jgi:hypothetical protein
MSASVLAPGSSIEPSRSRLSGSAATTWFAQCSVLPTKKGPGNRAFLFRALAGHAVNGLTTR